MIAESSPPMSQVDEKSGSIGTVSSSLDSSELGLYVSKSEKGI